MCVKTWNRIEATGKNISKTCKSRYNIFINNILLISSNKLTNAFFIVSIEGSTLNLDISLTKLRELIESSYPNPLTIDDINK